MSQYPIKPIDPIRRRIILGATSAALASQAQTTAFAQSALPARNAGDPIRLAQLLDSSQDQQEISRDYATGVRLGVSDFNRTARRRIQLVNFESDGSPASLKSVMQSIRKDPGLCALIGTAGERISLDSIEAARSEGLMISHLAPWLSDTRFDNDRDVVPVFASHEMQIRYAMKSLESLGIVDIGLVYSSERAFSSLHVGVEAAAKTLKLRSVTYTPRNGEDLASLANRLPGNSPAVLLFLGGTIELSQFAQSLSARKLQRYVVSLADIDVGTLVELGASRAVPLILTQVVPNPQSSTLPAVRDYRASLKAQFDEKPSQISLAGYLAARYVLPVLARMDRAPTREAVLAEFERRMGDDIGGFRIGFNASQRRGSSYVTQTLLTGDGRLVG
jgi:ABC-type branched-subunit amino acid transport system substrate-binding protein